MSAYFGTADIAGYMAGACILAAFAMRRIIPLRIAGIAGNVCFIAYGYMAHAHPALVLHSLLLPLNIVRLIQMKRLIGDVRRSATGDLSLDWLSGFSVTRRYAAGEVVFRKGDEATSLFYVVDGRFELPELSVSLSAGAVIGELGIVSAGNRRTQTVVCVEAGKVLTVSYDQVRQLYFQNPKFGFYLLRLIGERLSANLDLARQIAV